MSHARTPYPEQGEQRTLTSSVLLRTQYDYRGLPSGAMPSRDWLRQVATLLVKSRLGMILLVFLSRDLSRDLRSPFGALWFLKVAT